MRRLVVFIIMIGMAAALLCGCSTNPRYYYQLEEAREENDAILEELLQSDSPDVRATARMNHFKRGNELDDIERKLDSEVARADMFYRRMLSDSCLPRICIDESFRGPNYESLDGQLKNYRSDRINCSCPDRY